MPKLVPNSVASGKTEGCLQRMLYPAALKHPSLPSFCSGWWRRVTAVPWDTGVCKHTRQCQCCSSSLLLNKSHLLLLYLPSLSELKAEMEPYTSLWAGARISHSVGSLGAETSWQTLLQVHPLLCLLHCPYTPLLSNKAFYRLWWFCLLSVSLGSISISFGP